VLNQRKALTPPVGARLEWFRSYINLRTLMKMPIIQAGDRAENERKVILFAQEFF